MIDDEPRYSGRMLECSDEPAEWTDTHRALADEFEALGLPPGEPRWLRTVVGIDDADGLPAGVRVTMTESISNCRKLRLRTILDWICDDDD